MEEEDELWENSTWSLPEIEDDTRIDLQQFGCGWLIEDVSDANSLERFALRSESMLLRLQIWNVAG